MRIVYDTETDTLVLLLREGAVSESDELREGLIVDYDHEGQVIGFEVLDASRYIADPQSIEYQLKGRLVSASGS